MNEIKTLLANTPIKKTRDMREDEYIGEDGLFHCKVCKKARQFLFIDERIVNCLCECEERARNEIQYKEKCAQLKKLSLIGERYKDANFNNTETGFNPSFDIALNRCKRYCEVADEALKRGAGIYLYGSKGTGKTRLQVCMIDELTRRGKPCLLTNFFEISKGIRATFNTGAHTETEFIEKLANVEFLFIDDLGTELVKRDGADNWLQEKVFEILNKRYNNLMPTIFSSNHSLNELINERGFMEKTIDRICEMTKGAVMKIEGTSYRMRKQEAFF